MPANTTTGARSETAAAILIAALESKNLIVGHSNSDTSAEKIAAAFQIIYAGVVAAEGRG